MADESFSIARVAEPIRDAPLEVQWALLVAEGFSEEEVEAYLTELEPAEP